MLLINISIIFISKKIIFVPYKTRIRNRNSKQYISTQQKEITNQRINFSYILFNLPGDVIVGISHGEGGEPRRHDEQ